MQVKYAHALWRIFYFKASGHTPPNQSIFGSDMDMHFAKQLQAQKSSVDIQNMDTSLEKSHKIKNRNKKVKKKLSGKKKSKK